MSCPSVDGEGFRGRRFRLAGGKRENPAESLQSSSTAHPARSIQPAPAGRGVRDAAVTLANEWIGSSSCLTPRGWTAAAEAPILTP